MQSHSCSYRGACDWEELQVQLDASEAERWERSVWSGNLCRPSPPLFSASLCLSVHPTFLSRAAGWGFACTPLLHLGDAELGTTYTLSLSSFRVSPHGLASILCNEGKTLVPPFPLLHLQERHPFPSEFGHCARPYHPQQAVHAMKDTPEMKGTQAGAATVGAAGSMHVEGLGRMGTAQCCKRWFPASF